MSINDSDFATGGRFSSNGEPIKAHWIPELKRWGTDNIYPEDMTERAFPRLKLEETKINGLELNFAVIDEAREHYAKLEGLQNTIMEKMTGDLNKQMDDVFIEGLKRKGFEFENRVDLETFIKQYVRCADYESLKEKIYFVKDRPFLLYYYKAEFETPKVEDYSVSVSANYGHYAYL